MDVRGLFFSKCQSLLHLVALQQTDRQTNITENIISLSEIIMDMRGLFHFSKYQSLLHLVSIWRSINQSITGSISIRDFGDHGPPLIAILCLSNCSSIVNSHPVSDVAEPSGPWSSSSLSCRQLYPLAIGVGIHIFLLLTICPKYLHFLSFIIFMSCGLAFKPTKMLSLLICCWYDIFNILL